MLAQVEAERLAKRYPGQEFYILRAISVSYKTEVTTVRL